MNVPHSTTAIVIGAGLSGLAAATELRARNIPVTILEASDRVADPWRARHPRLRLNIHRHFARLPGHHEPRNPDTFLPRDAVVDYLSEYARQLDADIHFETRVLSVHRVDDIWKIETNNGDYFCEHLIVATGRENVPDMPVWPGMDEFGGSIIHAADFGDPSDYDGKKVLVIGAGNSGTDVLNHLSRSNPAQVWVSVRHGPSILPSRVFGFSLQRLANLFSRFPKWSLDPIFSVMQHSFFGNLRRYGLRRHAMGGGSRMLKDGVTFALDDGFVAALKAWRFAAVRETVGFTPNAVELADGQKIYPEVVICATGYRADLDGLFGHMRVLDIKGYPLHPMGEEDPRNPGLWFTGYGLLFQGFFHAAGVSANRIAKGIEANTGAHSLAPGYYHSTKVATQNAASLEGAGQ
ncbi:flavin-containing monooxygenase [Ruegeria lacuscaerulensis]|uniref:flavin-containing monooxygenase n=1 Tax=Ruegeria lacuscaerulensis TaxID=55218 RepID=UPI00147BEFC9|nr:NAD(P)/FAD-dependent oxidoreductase [Ruegeria lacuscaerulensis]